MVGVVIDDAIVVLENIFRFVEEKRMTAMRAAKEATADIGLAVMATTFSLVVIFLPVSFMSSISGRFLFQFGITAAVAVLVSLLVSFTLLAACCAIVPRLLLVSFTLPAACCAYSFKSLLACVTRSETCWTYWLTCSFSGR